jgi:hypothetical protein
MAKLTKADILAQFDSLSGILERKEEDLSVWKDAAEKERLAKIRFQKLAEEYWCQMQRQHDVTMRILSGYDPQEDINAPISHAEKESRNAE